MESDFAEQPSQNPAIDGKIAGPKSPQDTEREWREYLFFREELRHEDNLLNQRISWLVGSQAFLLGAFATLITFNGSRASNLESIRTYMLIGLPIAGLLGGLANYVTILAAVMHVRGIRHLVGHRHPPQMPSLVNWGTLQLRMGLFGPLVTPLIFLGFWTTILVRMR